jgi:uncharacterized phage protein (TIGR01671 family)
MREIKFRAWDEEKHAMVPDAEIYFEKYTLFSEDMNGMTKSKQSIDFRKDFIASLQFKFRLMQFTGLRDKNGKEVYEGDLVKVKDSDIFGDQEYVQRVEIVNGFWKPTMMFINGNEAEVIGNIYENTDLLPKTDY